MNVGSIKRRVNLDGFHSLDISVYEEKKTETQATSVKTLEEKTKNNGKSGDFRRNNTGSKTIGYGETLRLTAVAQNMPADAKIVWYVDEKLMGEGTTFEFTSEGGTAEISVKIVDSNGNNYADSDTQKVTVNAGFFQKIISFFKNLFGFSRIVTQAFRFN